ncbi:DNA-binding domain-containing protein [Pseudoalteromonas obscura]|uniref:DNA-binding domain-containing protein n=1 Tax=Pseudoalteromonas obscura TaxID=3048491 RepID=A0ABT7ESJ4_9GAMM|nr:putative DNA-binding domain-containing protein [Pseudoalteromonas sp. P94(2023)]MDK2598029.1 putative DNA-binding domain-containing protein [Pseudoalteromonas sp. P94(2023)]
MSFHQVQADFVAHIKDPQNFEKPSDVEDRRMQVYRELFFNNVEGFIASAFPVLKSLYDNDDWLALVRQFFAQHKCETPYFLEISQEFLRYLDEEYNTTETDPTFMYELAHYEWVELNVSILKRAQGDGLFEEDIDESVPLYLSSVAQCVQYTYPVHQIQIDFQPTEPEGGPFSFVVYRDSDEETRFIALNPMTNLLLASIELSPGISVSQLSTQLSEQIPGFTAKQLEVGALQTLQQFTQLGIVVDKVDSSTLLKA